MCTVGYPHSQTVNIEMLMTQQVLLITHSFLLTMLQTKKNDFATSCCINMKLDTLMFSVYER